jgi:hypothetical protein
MNTDLIQNGMKFGDEIVSEIAKIHSDTIDTDAVLWECMTACAMELIFRSYRQQEIAYEVNKWSKTAEFMLLDKKTVDSTQIGAIM